MFCPCALFIVMEKLSQMGNCFLFRLKRSMSSSDRLRVILGRRTRLPLCSPTVISASITFAWKPLHTSLVPLHRPFEGSMFHNKIIGHPIFKWSLCGGNPLIVIEFRNSVGYRWWRSSSVVSKL
ncbi:hypothetical protein L1987_40201 [Smallanthus sonchifolius]|uniref:Uncharacterized protein n=1 Tax=Smallanthus sonchifolius TaxID=185202 RepID=A0ACB9GTE6_9ASTR|nr:hypothetical protein L1987_40201 [Smallanthus sonchifolius]